LLKASLPQNSARNRPTTASKEMHEFSQYRTHGPTDGWTNQRQGAESLMALDDARAPAESRLAVPHRLQREGRWKCGIGKRRTGKWQT